MNDENNKDHINEHLNRKDRSFHFHDKVTYIEKQEITMQKGSTFNNGPEAEGKTRVEEKEEPKEEHNITSAPSPELSTIDRIYNGLRAVVTKGMMKSDYYYGAIVKFINEKKDEFFGSEMTYADIESILMKSKLFEEGKHPKKGTIQRIAISGKFPNWKIDKGVDVWIDIKDMIDTFYKVYKE